LLPRSLGRADYPIWAFCCSPQPDLWSRSLVLRCSARRPAGPPARPAGGWREVPGMRRSLVFAGRHRCDARLTAALQVTGRFGARRKHGDRLFLARAHVGCEAIRRGRSARAEGEVPVLILLRPRGTGRGTTLCAREIVAFAAQRPAVTGGFVWR